MGWYHVDHFGKGIFMGEARKIKYNEDFLAKYVPSKEEAIAFGKGEYGEAKFADYEMPPNCTEQNSPVRRPWTIPQTQHQHLPNNQQKRRASSTRGGSFLLTRLPTEKQ